MSDSPRQLIRRAHDALSQLNETLVRHPEAARELERVLGPDLLESLRSATAAVGQAHAILAPQAVPPVAPSTHTTPALAAKTLGDPARVAERRSALDRPHMQPLVRFADAVRRAARTPVADFDPFDGGIEAEVLFLLEAPGAQTVRTGFISRDNPDESARAWLEVNTEAGLPRERTATWNAVPWIVEGSPNAEDLREAEPHLRQVLTLFPRLRALVLVGRKAEKAVARVDGALPEGVVVLRCPHPSPRNLNTRVGARQAILETLLKVRHLLER